MDDILNYKKNEDDDYYTLLGCDETSSADQILAEYKVQSLKYHPDKNSDINAAAKFQKIKKAKEVLLDPEKRIMYNKWRCCGFSFTFEHFLNLNKSSHTSIHWATKKEKDLCLESACASNETKPNKSCDYSEMEKCKTAIWDRDPPNDVLRKFRNYEI